MARVVLALVVLALALWVGATIYLHFNPFYAVSPGDAVPVGQLISVPPGRAHPIARSVMLADVLLGPVTAAELPSDLLDPYVQMEPAWKVLGPGGSPQKLQNQSVEEMTQSKDFATIAALGELPIDSHGTGALVVGYIPGTPASRWVRTDDVVMAVNGQRTTGPSGLEAAIGKHAPGDIVSLTVANAVQGTERTVTSRLVAGSSQTGTAGQALIGVQVFPQPVAVHQLAFSVSISSEQIGGPSAGLAFALGIVDMLSTGHLTSGHLVAATGEIDPNGDIAPIGGLPQKTVAVRNAGATVFLVPYGEPAGDYAEAHSFAHGRVRIVKVRSLAQALEELKGLASGPVSP